MVLERLDTTAPIEDPLSFVLVAGLVVSRQLLHAAVLADDNAPRIPSVRTVHARAVQQEGAASRAREGRVLHVLRQLLVAREETRLQGLSDVWQ